MAPRLAVRLGVLAIAAPALIGGALPTSSWAAPRAGATMADHLGHRVPARGAPHQLRANPSVIGLALSGTGTSLEPPTSPTNKPYSPHCQALIDPGFSGKCVVAVAPSGTIAGVVETETVPVRATAGHAPPAVSTTKRAPGTQERDLVWRRYGDNWTLALVRVSHDPGLSSLMWADDIERDNDPKLVVVTPSARAGFGAELDLVEGTGDVVLYRFLGQGFADAPPTGGLVTYVPGWTEQAGPMNAYDQTLIGYSNGAWRVFSEQYVPDVSSLRQHRGAFWDVQAVAAR